jgi:hypothetical protein
VLGQLATLLAGIITQLTLVRLLTCVDSHVGSEDRFPIKLLHTSITLEGFDACMCVHVSIKLRLTAPPTFITGNTYKSILPCSTSLCTRLRLDKLVSCNHRRCCTDLIILLASICTLNWTHHIMPLQLDLSLTVHVAVLALVQTPAMHGPTVLHQIRNRAEKLSTLYTLLTSNICNKNVFYLIEMRKDGS